MGWSSRGLGKSLAACLARNVRAEILIFVGDKMSMSMPRKSFGLPKKVMVNLSARRRSSAVAFGAYLANSSKSLGFTEAGMGFPPLPLTT